MKSREQEIELIFNNYFSSLRTANANAPSYGVKVDSLNEEGSKIVSTITFLKGQEYCCGEITCHFEPNWDRIRELATIKGVSLTKPLKIELAVQVEEGAILATNGDIGAPLKSPSFKYKEVFEEQTL